MLKVALRGLDRVGRDNPVPMERNSLGHSCWWWGWFFPVAALWRGTPRFLGGADVAGRWWQFIWACTSTAVRVSDCSSSRASLISPSLQGEPTSPMESARTLP